MIKLILNTLATGFSDEEIVFKHERNLRIYMNWDFSMFVIQGVFCMLELAGCGWFLWMK